MNTDHFTTADRRQSSVDLATAYLAQGTELYKRAVFAQHVIRNTLLKLSHMSIPSNLTWALPYNAQLHIIGVSSRTEGYNFSAGERWLNDETGFTPTPEVTDQDHLVVFINGTARVGYIPLELLTYDPIRISQWVRAAVRRETAQVRAGERQAAIRNRSNTLAQHARDNRNLVLQQQRELRQIEEQVTDAERRVKPRRAELRRAGLLGGNREV